MIQGSHHTQSSQESGGGSRAQRFPSEDPEAQKAELQLHKITWFIVVGQEFKLGNILNAEAHTLSAHSPVWFRFQIQPCHLWASKVTWATEFSTLPFLHMDNELLRPT